MDSRLDRNYSEFLPDQKDIGILDFGCGSGRVLSYLKDKGYTNLLGVDIDSDVINQVPDSLQSHVRHIQSIDDFLGQNEKFDLIILKDVIYYFPRHTLVDTCRKITDMLNPGGRVIVEVFNGAQLTASYTANKDIGIQTVLTESSLKQALENCNLRVLTLFEQKQKMGGPFSIIYRLLRFFWRIHLKAIYLFERGIDSNNPKFLGKSLIAVAERKN